MSAQVLAPEGGLGPARLSLAPLPICASIHGHAVATVIIDEVARTRAIVVPHVAPPSVVQGATLEAAATAPTRPLQ